MQCPPQYYFVKIFTIICLCILSPVIGWCALGEIDNYATGDTPQQIAVADFNNDTYPDLAITNRLDDDVSVYLNQQDGTFAAKVDYPTLAIPASITTCDVNNDQDLDIVIGSGYHSTFSVLIGNGDGTFAAHVGYNISYPADISCADYNGDNFDDVAATDFQLDRLGVVLNDGDGTFGTATYYGAEDGVWGLGSADFNHDTHSDLVTSSWFATGGAKMSVYLNNGDGTFAARVGYDNLGYGYHLLVVDLNSDTYADVVAQNMLYKKLSVFINNGDGTFAARVDYDVKEECTPVASADLDHDGHPDLIASDGDQIMILRNQGDGTMGDLVLLPSGGSAEWVAAGDFAKDNYPELAVLNQNDDRLSIRPTGYDLRTVYAAPELARTVIADDFNQDTFLDLAVNGIWDEIVAVYLNNGDGSFAAGVNYTFGDKDVETIDSGDLNGDGYPDLAAADDGSTMMVRMNNGDGTFGAVVEYAGGDEPQWVEIADYDGDGWLDIATADYDDDALSIYLNNGDGTFADRVSYETGESPTKIISGKFNADAYPDLATCNAWNSPDNISVLLNNGDGTFDDYLDVEVGNSVESIAAGDLDLDGIDDLVAVDPHPYYNGVHVLYNDGAGTFSVIEFYYTADSPDSVALSDFDQDGRLDIASTNMGFEKGESLDLVVLLLNQGIKGFSGTVGYTAGRDTSGLVAGDFAHDGYPDIAVALEEDEQLLILTNKGTDQPEIAVHDSVPPVDDLEVLFGVVEPGNHEDQIVTVENFGSSPLTIGTVGAVDPLEAPFSFVAKACSGEALDHWQTCEMTVRYAPTGPGPHNDSFDIPSDDNDENPATVSVLGGVQEGDDDDTGDDDTGDDDTGDDDTGDDDTGDDDTSDDDDDNDDNDTGGDDDDDNDDDNNDDDDDSCGC